MCIRSLALLVLLIIFYKSLSSQSACYRVATHTKISNTRGLIVGPLTGGSEFGDPALIGDINSDGIDDIVVGQPLNDDGGTDRGAVWVLMLDEYGRVKAQQRISSTQGGFTGSLSNTSFFGQSVVGLGDIDGDNIPDIAVGANGDDDGGSNRGAVWILRLNANGTVKAHQKISDTQGNFTGILDNDDFFGSHLGATGDINKDGNMDLAVGAFGDDDGSSSAGAVWILFLDSVGQTINHQKISATQGGFTGTLDAGDRFAAAGRLGDLNGDGKLDLIVGAERDDDGGLDFGAAWILFLDTTGTVISHQKISATTGGFTGTLTSATYFGCNAQTTDDLDSDGIPDIIVGSMADDDGGTDRGAFYLIYLNANGTVKGIQHYSDLDGNFIGKLDNSDIFGRHLSYLGDFNHDGLPDIALSANGDDDGIANSGATWIVSLEACGKTCIALPQQNTFHKIYAAPQSDRGHSLLVLNDGYMLAGLTSSSGAGGDDLFLMKVDLKGDTVWTKTYGGTGNDWGFSIHLEPAKDSGYFMVGATTSFNSGNNGYVLRLGETGNIIWQKRFANQGIEHPRGMGQTSDSGIVVVGTNGFMFKLDKFGNLIWNKFYNLASSFNSHFIDCIEMPDKSLIFPGEYSRGTGGRQAVLVKTDSIGNKIWEKIFDGPGPDGFMDAMIDGNTLLLLGVTHLGSGPLSKAFLLRVDTLGREIWSRYYDSGNGLERGGALIKLSNGRYAVSCYTENYANQRNLIFEVDEYGNMIWSKAYPGNGIALESWWGDNLRETPDGGMVFLSYSDQVVSANYDVMLMKIDGCGEAGCNSVAANPIAEEWPFPASTYNSVITSGGTLANVASQVSFFEVDDTTICESSSHCTLMSGFIADTVCLGDTTHFTDLSVDTVNSIVNWKWYTGTGDSLNGNINVMYQYGMAGTYQASLIITSDDTTGCMDTITKPVVVLDIPMVDLGNDTSLCFGDTIILYAWDSGSVYLWQNSSTDSILTATTTGMYFVEVSNGVCPSVSDTILLQFDIPPQVFLGNDTILCEDDSLVLDATVAGGSYLWQNNAVTPTFLVTNAGTYSVKVDSGQCSASDSINISYVLKPIVNLGNDTVLCYGDSLVLHAGNPGANYLWQNSSTDSVFTADTSGTFYVFVSNGICQDVKDTINITFDLLPQVNLGNDTILCQGDSMILDATISGGTYIWQDNSTNPTYTAKITGTYFVAVDSGACTVFDSVNINVVPVPFVNLGNDTTICDLDLLRLDALSTGGIYVWSTSETTPAIFVNQPGTYWVEVGTGANDCQATDTIVVDVVPSPIVDLGNDTSFCSPGSVTLRAVYPGASAQWWDSSFDSTKVVDRSGDYFVIMSLGFCKYIDSINVQVDSVPNINLSNHYYQCEGDSLRVSVADGWPTYLWSTGSVESSTFLSVSGSFWVVVSNGSCTDSSASEFSFVSRPEEALLDSVLLCDSSFVRLDARNEGFTYLWSTNETTKQIKVSKPGLYHVLISNNGQCVIEDSIYVVACHPEFIIPNTITPNGDGANDTWIIENIDDYPGNRVLIFNRNGFLLFETTNYQNDWNGTYNDQQLPATVYFYILELNNGGRPYKGTITVVREQ